MEEDEELCANCKTLRIYTSEKMILQASFWHVLVNQEPVFTLWTVADEFYKIRVV